MFGNIVQQSAEEFSDTTEAKEEVQQWLKRHKIPGFYTISQNQDLRDGARNCMTMSGRGFKHNTYIRTLPLYLLQVWGNYPLT